jgi:hypothetical protein
MHMVQKPQNKINTHHSCVNAHVKFFFFFQDSILKYVYKENLITVECVIKGYSFWILGYLGVDKVT